MILVFGGFNNFLFKAREKDNFWKAECGKATLCGKDSRKENQFFWQKVICISFPFIC